MAPGRLILATSDSNLTIVLTQIGLGHEPDWDVVLHDWSAVAIWPTPGTLAVKLGYNEEHKRVEVEVVHQVDNFRLRSVYHELDDGEERNFAQVSREGMRLPATVPSGTPRTKVEEGG